MLGVGMLAVLTATVLMVVRAVRGPGVFDRLIAATAVGNAAILILAIYGFLMERPEFLDIGLTYALLNIIGTLAVLKFLRFGALGHAGDEGDEQA